jgi:hypothetical protein
MPGLLAYNLVMQEARLLHAVSSNWCMSCCYRTDMGGSTAHRSPEQGAASVVWAVEHAGPSIHGGFFRDGKPVECESVA